jgi:hypothetical protein
MQHFILQVLNQNFRPPGPVSTSLFPDHEFDKQEAGVLKLFCDKIHTEGYEHLFKQKESKDTRDIVDLAAEYGHFVEKEATPWYLGVFIAAECLMEPYACESFYDQMLRSEVFAAAADEWKKQALWLMLMAFFCHRSDTTARRVGLFIEACSELGYSLEKLSIESFCSVSRMIKGS